MGEDGRKEYSISYGATYGTDGALLNRDLGKVIRSVSDFRGLPTFDELIPKLLDAHIDRVGEITDSGTHLHSCCK